MAFFTRPNLATGNLSNISFVFSNSTTGVNTNLNISFTAQNSVSNGILFLSFPTEYFFMSNANRSCFSQNNTISLNCSLSTLNGSNLGESIIIISINNISCQANSIVNIQIFNTVKNKPSNQPFSSSDSSILVITLDNNNNTIDSGTLNVNDNLPTNFNNFNKINFTRTANFVSQNTDLLVFFENLNRLPKNSYFQIFLPFDQ